ncbi:hypothetical protein BDQ17DRAFT_1492996 [Cyathus striatus]|nr:hypothetical protein BDQ17DRAFT_1492996 [Cyathus striatus]
MASDSDDMDDELSDGNLGRDSDEDDSEMSTDQLSIDISGDLFGDYEDYNAQELGMDAPEDLLSESDEEEIDNDAMNADEEARCEPECQPNNDLLGDQSQLDSESQSGASGVAQQREEAEESHKNKPFITSYPGQAGVIISSHNENGNDTYGGNLGPSSTTFSELIKIEGVAECLGLTFKTTSELNKIIDNKLPGRPHFVWHEVLVGSEVCDVYFRDVMACVRALFGDSNFAPYLVFAPEKHHTDGGRGVGMYHDMYTGRWWWKTQAALEQHAPGATIIPIIISTDKTQLTLFRNKSAYPVYLSIGNIPKEIRRKPSSRAYVLLGYLPTTRLENKILKPLEKYGEQGMGMTTAYGNQYRAHPLFATFIGDYPEQVLTACVYNMDCPDCPVKNTELGTYNNEISSSVRDIDAILTVLESFDTNTEAFLQTCKEARIKPVIDPFWKNLPFVNIYQSITPDILHQLYQGIIKHLISWVIKAFGVAEIDARCCRLPPNHNIHIFTKGISSLTHVTGQEHHQMAQILMGLIVNIPLPGGLSSARLVRSVRAILDFLYISQYPLHTDETLQILEDSLNRFHENKQIFIKLFDAYKATNHKDEFPQMTVWLERKEKIYRHEQYILWCKAGRPQPEQKDCKYGAIYFREAFAQFISLERNPNLRYNADVEHAIWGVLMPLQNFHVWHHIKFLQKDPFTGVIYTADSIHVCLEWNNGRHEVPGRFDTALIEEIEQNAEITGIAGKVGRIRVIFSISPHIKNIIFRDPENAPQHMAYVEWYNSNNLMYKISKLQDQNEDPSTCEIIPVQNIQCSIHLFPRFGHYAPAEWSSSNVLDQCTSFFVNNFTDKHLY